jgi:hypothetical protein
LARFIRSLSRKLLVQQTSDHMTKRLMFPSSIAFAKKISKLHWREFAAGWLVGSMKNKQAVVVAPEKPSAHRLRSGKSLVL